MIASSLSCLPSSDHIGEPLSPSFGIQSTKLLLKLLRISLRPALCWKEDVREEIGRLLPAYTRDSL
jgi:hypothetical protein